MSPLIVWWPSALPEIKLCHDTKGNMNDDLNDLEQLAETNAECGALTGRLRQLFW